MRNLIGWLQQTLARAFLSKPVNAPSQNCAPGATAQVKVLAVLGQAADRKTLEDLAGRHEWKMFFAASHEEARNALGKIKPHVILFDRDGDPGGWRFTVSSLSAASDGGCVLLISRVVDEYLWNEVVSNGGYDVVRKPLSEDDVVRNVKLAWSYWKGTRGPRTAATK